MNIREFVANNSMELIEAFLSTLALIVSVCALVRVARDQKMGNSVDKMSDVSIIIYAAITHYAAFCNHKVKAEELSRTGADAQENSSSEKEHFYLDYARRELNEMLKSINCCKEKILPFGTANTIAVMHKLDCVFAGPLEDVRPDQVAALLFLLYVQARKDLQNRNIKLNLLYDLLIKGENIKERILTDAIEEIKVLKLRGFYYKKVRFCWWVQKVFRTRA